MRDDLAALRHQAAPPADVDPSAVLGAMAAAVLVLDQNARIHYANAGAEQLFESGASHLCQLGLADLVPADSPIFGLIHQAQAGRASVSDYDVVIDTPRTGMRTLTVQVSPLPDREGLLVVTMHEHSIALKIGAQLSHRGAARSVSAMAAILAHEVKNPLSGIRGAAQLLEQSVADEDRVLTQLICDEADRIVALVDRMEVFSDDRPIDRQGVNIHRVLEHVRRVAENGFARQVRFIEHYDPSLPKVLGNRDHLVQAFLNLVKNAAEAVPAEGGEIILSTAYQHGVRIAVPGSDAPVHLPLVVSIQDNGAGIPEDLRQHLFDAFVTTKATGTGLGLALVAKIIGAHGGVVEFDSLPRRTTFRVMLPIVHEEDA